ncbi:hypothetical protein [Lactobacillus kitasatonis]|uniref:Uncharacterized protein n=1 Tax=Lactobacillus kitasatonis DSM 16761 = JCM 1039 TaxID=1423767 RepID=A0A0R1VM24_9LACO|nr:hypothetical protein [Lactobacillus kitasatonis]KRM06737.1 hypothetical protein FC59_GL001654 [Lactobacillus kitasatonis DSM 16761 = JCM 1039]
MLYSQEQINEINRQNEIKKLEILAENDPDTLVVYLPDNQEALIGKYADDFTNGYKSAAQFLKGRLNHYNGDLNKLADEMDYNDVSPDHFDFILDLNNYEDLLELVKDSYDCETLTSYLDIDDGGIY